MRPADLDEVPAAELIAELNKRRVEFRDRMLSPLAGTVTLLLFVGFCLGWAARYLYAS